MVKRIGVLIPEFPGQTHNFFWREIEALREFGVEVVLFSTRHPPKGVQSTAWGRLAMMETTYLFPVAFSSLFFVVRDLLVSPSRFLRCFQLFLSSAKALNEGESRFRLFVLMLIGVFLGRMCRERGLQHIHVHSCADAANVVLFSHAAFGMSYSLTLHNPLTIWGGNQDNKWSKAKFGIVIADWILADMQQKLGSALPPKVLIAPMGVNLQVFKRKAVYAPAQDGVLRVFSCARLNPAKGFEVLLQAIARLIAAGQDVTLTIAGEDDRGGNGYRKDLETIITSQGLEKAVFLLGAVSEERVRAELETAHLFVLASFEEPLGVAIMEAMAMEVPVISTSAGGVPSIITDGLDGILVPPGDSTALAAAISRVASDPGLAMDLSSRGRLRISDAFHHRLSAKAISENV